MQHTGSHPRARSVVRIGAAVVTGGDGGLVLESARNGEGALGKSKEFVEMVADTPMQCYLLDTDSLKGSINDG